MPKLKAEFIKIELSDGKSLKITSKHYIYKSECTHENKVVPVDQMNHIPVFAEKVEIGDCLYVLSADQPHTFEQRRVQTIDIVEEVGIYAPMTSTTNIIVNDIYASCYNVVNNQVMYDFFTQDIQNIPSIGSIFGESVENEVDLPLGTRLIIGLMKYVLPNNIYSA